MQKGTDQVTLPKMLNEGQVARLILSLATLRDQRGFSEAEAAKLVKWAEWSLLQAELVSLILKGAVFADMDNDNSASFDDMTFLPTTMVLSDTTVKPYLDMLVKASDTKGESKSV